MGDWSINCIMVAADVAELGGGTTGAGGTGGPNFVRADIGWQGGVSGQYNDAGGDVIGHIYYVGGGSGTNGCAGTAGAGGISSYSFVGVGVVGGAEASANTMVVEEVLAI